MQTKKIKLTDIKLNTRNPRIIRDDMYDRLINSLLIFPQMLELRPVVINEEGEILGGNMRTRSLQAIAEMDTDVLARRLYNIKQYQEKSEKERKALVEFWDAWLTNPQVPVVNAKDLTPEQEKEFIIKDNAAFGEWDWDMLANDFDRDLLAEWGITTWQEGEDEVAEETKEAHDDGYTDEEADQAESICQPGDQWVLGDHRLMCGDSTKKEDVAKLMDGATADLWLTDPPYNVEYVGKTKDALTIKNDSMNDSQFLHFLLDAFAAAAQSLKPGGAFYIWHADSEGYNFRTAVKETGLLLKQCLIWVKNTIVMGRQDYQWQHEPCLYGWKEGAGHYFTDSRTQSTVYEDNATDYKQLSKPELLKVIRDLLQPKVSTTIIREDKPSRSAEHPTMKPIRLMGRCVKNSTKPGERVLDTFGGSGSTLIACEQLGRRCYTMELDPHYCDVIIDRWEKYTGQKAIQIKF